MLAPATFAPCSFEVSPAIRFPPREPIPPPELAYVAPKLRPASWERCQTPDWVVAMKNNKHYPLAVYLVQHSSGMDEDGRPLPYEFTVGVHTHTFRTDSYGYKYELKRTIRGLEFCTTKTKYIDRARFRGTYHLCAVHRSKKDHLKGVLQTVEIVQGDPTWTSWDWAWRVVQKLMEAGYMEKGWWTEAKLRRKMENSERFL